MWRKESLHVLQPETHMNNVLWVCVCVRKRKALSCQ